MAKALPAQAAVKVINVSDERVRFQIATQAGALSRSFDMAPGDLIDLEPGYAMRRQASPDRDIQPSIVEQLTGGKVIPISDARAKEYMAQRERSAAAASSASTPAGSNRPTDEGAGDLTPPGKVKR